jgi:hypothetical protein
MSAPRSGDGPAAVAATPGPAVLAPFQRPPGRALMLGHVHPDADVLGTLLALGAALEARGWDVVYGGPRRSTSCQEWRTTACSKLSTGGSTSRS